MMIENTKKVMYSVADWPLSDLISLFIIESIGSLNHHKVHGKRFHRVGAKQLYSFSADTKLAALWKIMPIINYHLDAFAVFGICYFNYRPKG